MPLSGINGIIVGKDHGRIEPCVLDTVIAFELEVEPYDDMYEKMKRQKEIGM